MTRNLKPALWFLAANILVAVGLTYAFIDDAIAQTAAEAAAGAGAAPHSGMAMIGAAIAAGLATLGAGYAVAVVGAAAVGALAEKPELLGRLLIFVGLAEGIAIYGLIVAVLILNTV